MNRQRQKQMAIAGGLLTLGVVLFAVVRHGAPQVVDSQQITQMLPPAPDDMMKHIRTLARADAAIANAEGMLSANTTGAAGAKTNSGAASSGASAATSPDIDAPWQVAAESDKTVPSIPLNSAIKRYSVIKLNHHPAKFPAEGDKVSLPMFDGRSIAANVESVKTLGNGDRVWAGHVDGMSDDFPVVMTYGDKLTFATINTPDGSYSLEAKDGVGWLYKNPSVLDLAGPDSVDFLVPEIN